MGEAAVSRNVLTVFTYSIAILLIVPNEAWHSVTRGDIFINSFLFHFLYEYIYNALRKAIFHALEKHIFFFRQIVLLSQI